MPFVMSEISIIQLKPAEYSSSVIDNWSAVCRMHLWTVVETENEADKTKVQMPNFAPSKWETVDESELEAQGG